MQKALGKALKNWRPCGLLDLPTQRRALALALSMLKELHTHGDAWGPNAAQLLEASQVGWGFVVRGSEPIDTETLGL